MAVCGARSAGEAGVDAAGGADSERLRLFPFAVLSRTI